MYLVALAAVQALQKTLMHKKTGCTELWSIKESQVMRSNRIAIISCQHLPAGRHTCTCVGWAHSAALPESPCSPCTPYPVISLAGLPSVPLPASAKAAAPHSQLEPSPAIFCCWLDPVPAEQPLPSRAPDWFFNASYRGTHMRTTNATDNGFCQFSFQFLLFIPVLRFSRLWSSQLLEKGSTVQQYCLGS